MRLDDDFFTDAADAEDVTRAGMRALRPEHYVAANNVAKVLTDPDVGLPESCENDRAVPPRSRGRR